MPRRPRASAASTPSSTRMRASTARSCRRSRRRQSTSPRLLQDLEGGADEADFGEHPRCGQLVQLPGGVHRRPRALRTARSSRSSSRVCPARSPFRCRSARPSTARRCETPPVLVDFNDFLNQIEYAMTPRRSSTTRVKSDVLGPTSMPPRARGQDGPLRRRVRLRQPTRRSSRSRRSSSRWTQ